VDAAYERYLSAMAEGVKKYTKEQNAFPVVVASEMLDRDACQRIAEKLGGAPLFASDHYDMYQLVSILRACHRMVSSRYHAIVMTMPAGVLSVGVTMDERIRNLMRDRGHEHLLMGVDDAELEDRIVDALRALDTQAEDLRDAMGRTVVRNIQMMARMGMYFEEQVARRYPDFPIRQGELSWVEYLPPLGPGLRKLLETHSGVLAS
jgi:polysaccharide pyruvyl transferase WcaK-like protein